MERKTIIAFVGAIVDLVKVSRSEKPNFYFQSDSELTGNFDFKIWNSDKKNTPYSTIGTPLVKVDNLLTLTFDATTWQIPAGVYYYEINKIEDKRIFFKGEIEVIE